MSRRKEGHEEGGAGGRGGGSRVEGREVTARRRCKWSLEYNRGRRLGKMVQMAKGRKANLITNKAPGKSAVSVNVAVAPCSVLASIAGRNLQGCFCFCSCFCRWQICSRLGRVNKDVAYTLGYMKCNNAI